MRSDTKGKVRGESHIQLRSGGRNEAKMKKTNVTKIDASYVAPTVYVIEMASEGCLCGSIDRTESNDPDDYKYGGRL